MLETHRHVHVRDGVRVWSPEKDATLRESREQHVVQNLSYLSRLRACEARVGEAKVRLCSGQSPEGLLDYLSLSICRLRSQALVLSVNKLAQLARKLSVYFVHVPFSFVHA